MRNYPKGMKHLIGPAAITVALLGGGLVVSNATADPDGQGFAVFGARADFNPRFVKDRFVDRPAFDPFFQRRAFDPFFQRAAFDPFLGRPVFDPFFDRPAANQVNVNVDVFVNGEAD